MDSNEDYHLNYLIFHPGCKDWKRQWFLRPFWHWVFRLWLLWWGEWGSKGDIFLPWIIVLTSRIHFDNCFSFAFAYSIIPLSQICFPGCNCSPPGHADNETAGFPHCSWHREPDPHHPHLVHGQPSGQNLHLFASSIVLNHNMERCSNCPFSKTKFSLKLCLFLAFCPIKNSLLMICKLQLRLALIHNIFSFLLM